MSQFAFQGLIISHESVFILIIFYSVPLVLHYFCAQQNVILIILLNVLSVFNSLPSCGLDQRVK